MKLYISADIEGTTGITRWDETENGHSRYPYFAEQMTREVAAAINGALQVSRDFELLVKDAHDSACNLIPSKLAGQREPPHLPRLGQRRDEHDGRAGARL